MQDHRRLRREDKMNTKANILILSGIALSCMSKGGSRNRSKMSYVEEFSKVFNYPVGQCDLNRADCMAISNVFAEWLEDTYGIDTQLYLGEGFMSPVGEDAIPLYKHTSPSNFQHMVVKWGDEVIDLTGKQFGSQYANPIYPFVDFKRHWLKVRKWYRDSRMVNTIRREMLLKSQEAVRAEEKMMEELLKRLHGGSGSSNWWKKRPQIGKPYPITITSIERGSSNAWDKKGRKASQIQSIILSKEVFTKSEAKKWMKENKFKGKIDETENNYRFRLINPKKFVDGSFRTKKIKEGIQFVFGIPK
jgi:hypothetical protein